MTGAVHERGAAAARGERAAHEREQQEAAFVRKNKARVTVDDLFLMPGQAWATHAAISPSSRSRASRGGTCGVIPRTRSQSFRYRWFICTPKRCSITAATRGAVQRSVAKPKSHGLARIHRSTWLAWHPLSFGGRPRPGHVARPASPNRPRPRQRLSQRHTDRSLTSSRSATSSGASPSFTINTAKRRSCSADNAFRGRSMGSIVAHVRFY
jgi:hypothetical protein